MIQWRPSNYVLSNYIPVTEAGCWIWLGGTDDRGYGITSMSGGKKLKAHRAFYESHVGPIPDGAIICHRCNTTSCVNPDHLYAGDPRSNAKDRGLCGHHGPAKLKPAEVREIRTLIGKRRAAEIANSFNVSLSAIYNIASGRTWSEI